MLRLTDIFFANGFLKGGWVFEKITLVGLAKVYLILRYKEFKLTVGYTGIVQPKKNRKSANHMRIKSDKV